MFSQSNFHPQRGGKQTQLLPKRFSKGLFMYSLLHFSNLFVLAIFILIFLRIYFFTILLLFLFSLCIFNTVLGVCLNFFLQNENQWRMTVLIIDRFASDLAENYIRFLEGISDALSRTNKNMTISDCFSC